MDIIGLVKGLRRRQRSTETESTIPRLGHRGKTLETKSGISGN